MEFGGGEEGNRTRKSSNHENPAPNQVGKKTKMDPEALANPFIKKGLRGPGI